MTGSRTDYARLLRLQRAVKASRERELAVAKNRVAIAEKELEELLRLMSDASPVLDLFPDVVARRIDKTMDEKADAERVVSESGDHVLREKRKLETIENRHAEHRASDLRDSEAAAQSETIDQRVAQALSASSKISKLR